MRLQKPSALCVSRMGCGGKKTMQSFCVRVWVGARGGRQRRRGTSTAGCRSGARTSRTRIAGAAGRPAWRCGTICAGGSRPARPRTDSEVGACDGCARARSAARSATRSTPDRAPSPDHARARAARRCSHRTSAHTPQQHQRARVDETERRVAEAGWDSRRQVGRGAYGVRLGENVGRG